MRRILLDFGADTLDVHIQRFGVANVIGPPDTVDQLVASHHTALILHEIFEKLEFLQREEHVLSAHHHLMLADLHGNVAADQRNIVIGGFRRVGHHLVASQHRTHPRQQLAERVRLGDVVVRTDFQTDHLVDFRAFRGEHDDRHTALLTNSAA